MATIKEIIDLNRPAEEIISDLKDKSINVPTWTKLIKEYDPTKHPVMNKGLYPDVVNDDGTIDMVTRVTYDLQRLAVKRMVELCYGIPLKRIYHSNNDRQAEIAKYIEAIFQRTRIDSVNIERGNMLFAGCEVMTLWYAIEQRNNLYGFNSPLKLRCVNYSPMQGDSLYPLFDEYGDMIALSVGYTRKKGKNTVYYFDAMTNESHLKWENSGKEWNLIEHDDITAIGKIPGVYLWRPTPIWEDTSKIVFEIEWALSRNGNYLRKNSKPIFGVFADEQIDYGNEDNENTSFRTIAQFPKGSDAKYIIWEQAIDNLKFYVTELRQSFFTQLQMPDWSYESMKATPMSGESRKQLFIDPQMKVRDESGRLLESHDREVNIVKSFLKTMLPDSYAADINALQVENIITPFTITDDKDTIANIMTATGGKAIMSQREGVQNLGWSDDVDRTMQEINEESKLDSFSLTE